MELETQLEISTIVNSPNVAELLSEDDLRTIGNRVYDEWIIDKSSREPWEEKMADAFKLALQVMDEKTFPWPGASNVKFPLVTIAAIQFHSRAYPALIPGPEVVKCKVYGEDNDNQLEIQARKISEHMSYQLLEEDETWEDNMDKSLISLPIVGCAFKKSYFDPVLEHNVSEHVLAKDLYIPYFAPSLEKAPRITQILYFSQNDYYERVASGIYLDWDSAYKAKPQDYGLTTLEAAKEEAQGIIKPSNDPATPYEMLEQHRYLDLDGDGYEEPYIVTVRRDTKEVCRIVARFYKENVRYLHGKIISILPEHFYTKYTFVPSPDGGIYDLGFGVLLGPLNSSINTIINQLIDSGTLSVTAGGFLGRGVKFRSGDNSFKPFEWKRVDSTGDDLRKGVMPLPVREPNAVLLQLLSLLVDYGERVGMATDPMVGKNPGQNTPAETSRNMIAEGSRVFNGIFKRVYRSMKWEFRKLFKLNKVFLPEHTKFDSFTNGVQVISRRDYLVDEKAIRPAADPFMISDEQKMQQANLLKSASMQTPGYNRYEVEKRWLQAIKITDIEKVFPNPKGPNAVPPPPNPKLQAEQLKAQVKQADIQLKTKVAMLKMAQEAELNRAKILELQAKAEKELAEANGVDVGHTIALINAEIAASKHRMDGVLKAMELLQSEAMKGETSGNINEGGMGGMAEEPRNHESMEIPATFAE